MRYVLAIAMLALLAGCSGAVSAPRVSLEPRSSLTVIGVGGLDAQTYPVLLDALRRQRPTILSSRGSLERLAVEIDGVRQADGVMALVDVRTADVLDVRRESGGSAVNGGPVLRIRLRRG